MGTALELIEQAKSVAAPQALNSALLTPEDVAIRRKFCDWVELWRHCAEPACRRARRCAGDPTPCFAEFWMTCPESTRIWAIPGICALEEGRRVREATHAADMSLLAYVRVSARLKLSPAWLKWPV